MDFPREKSDYLLWRISYGFLKIGKRLLGKDRTFAILLDYHWILRRLAFEEAGKKYGSIFHNQYLGLTEQWFLEQINPQDSVLDVGCGTGRWSNLASSKSNNVLGIDISENSLEIARSASTGAKFEYFDATSPIKTVGKFNVGILVHLLEHIEEPVSLLIDLLYVCDKLIIEVPDLEADPLNGIRILDKRPYYSDSDHVREYSEGLIHTQLESAGWKPLLVQKKGSSIAILAIPI